MKIEKKNNKYYVNDLDLEEVMANRKYVINHLDRRIQYLKDMKFKKDLYQFSELQNKELNTLIDIRKKMELRK